MIKRKKEFSFKALVGMILVMIFFIIAVLSVVADYEVLEVNAKEDFIIKIKNPNDQTYNFEIIIMYYDADNNIIYTKNVEGEVEPFGVKVLDATDYYQSKRATKITTSIQSEKVIVATKPEAQSETHEEQHKLSSASIIIGIMLFLLAIGMFVLFAITSLYGTENWSSFTCEITAAISYLVAILSIVFGLMFCAGEFGLT